MKHFLLLFLLILLGFSASAQNRIDYSNYQNTYSEKFQYQDLADLKKNWHTSPKHATQGSAKFQTEQISFLPQGIRLTATPLYENTNQQVDGQHFRYKSAMLRKPLEKPFGIFEIIAKIPNGQDHINDAWPIFKLVSKDVVINIFDGLGDINDKLAQNITMPEQLDTKIECGYDWNLADFNTGWDSDFYVFQMAWTPDFVTFFIQGREVATVDIKQLSIIDNMDLVIALQTHEAGSEDIHFDIQQVNVFEHKANAPYTYMSDHAWEFHTASNIKVKAGPGMITAGTNGVFFVSENGFLYKSTIKNGDWVTKKIGSEIIRGNLVYDAFNKLILYQDKDGYLSGLKQVGDDFEYYDKFNIKISAAPYAMAITKAGRLLALTENNLIVRIEFMDNNFFRVQSHELASNGDLVIAPNQDIYYKTKSNHLAAIHWDYSSFYNELYVPTVQLSSEAGAIVYSSYLTGKGIGYRGMDDKFHLIEETAYGPFPKDTPLYTYGIQDPAHTDYIASNLVGSINDVFYVSADGRLQVFGWDHPTQVRQHYWVDDNWFTQDYLADVNGDLVMGADKEIFYRTQTGKLGYFKWEPSSRGCNCSTLKNTVQDETTREHLQVSPNPTSDIFYIQLKAVCATCVNNYSLFSIDGKPVLAGSFTSLEHPIDIQHLPVGIYQLHVQTEKESFNMRVIKQ